MSVFRLLHTAASHAYSWKTGEAHGKGDSRLGLRLSLELSNVDSLPSMTQSKGCHLLVQQVSRRQRCGGAGVPGRFDSVDTGHWALDQIIPSIRTSPPTVCLSWQSEEGQVAGPVSPPFPSTALPEPVSHWNRPATAALPTLLGHTDTHSFTAVKPSGPRLPRYLSLGG